MHYGVINKLKVRRPLKDHLVQRKKQYHTKVLAMLNTFHLNYHAIEFHPLADRFKKDNFDRR